MLKALKDRFEQRCQRENKHALKVIMWATPIDNDLAGRVYMMLIEYMISTTPKYMHTNLSSSTHPRKP